MLLTVETTEIERTDRRQESRVRSLARRQGYRVQKSRARRTHLDNCREFMLIECDRNIPVLGWRFDADLDEIESWLREDETNV